MRLGFKHTFNIIFFSQFAGHIFFIKLLFYLTFNIIFFSQFAVIYFLLNYFFLSYETAHNKVYTHCCHFHLCNIRMTWSVFLWYLLFLISSRLDILLWACYHGMQLHSRHSHQRAQCGRDTAPSACRCCWKPSTRVYHSPALSLVCRWSQNEYWRYWIFPVVRQLCRQCC